MDTAPTPCKPSGALGARNAPLGECGEGPTAILERAHLEDGSAPLSRGDHNWACPVVPASFQGEGESLRVQPLQASGGQHGSLVVERIAVAVVQHASLSGLLDWQSPPHVRCEHEAAAR